MKPSTPTTGTAASRGDDPARRQRLPRHRHHADVRWTPAARQAIAFALAGDEHVVGQRRHDPVRRAAPGVALVAAAAGDVVERDDGGPVEALDEPTRHDGPLLAAAPEELIGVVHVQHVDLVGGAAAAIASGAASPAGAGTKRAPASPAARRA